MLLPLPCSHSLDSIKPFFLRIKLLPINTAKQKINMLDQRDIFLINNSLLNIARPKPIYLAVSD